EAECCQHARGRAQLCCQLDAGSPAADDHYVDALWPLLWRSIVGSEVKMHKATMKLFSLLGIVEGESVFLDTRHTEAVCNAADCQDDNVVRQAAGRNDDPFLIANCSHQHLTLVAI